MNKKTVSVIMIICLIPALAFGVTRKGAIKYAMNHSEYLKMAESSAKALEHEGEQASAISRPQFGFEGGWTEMGSNSPDSPISYLDSPDRNISAEAKLSQIRAKTDLPVGVGFGIKDAETAAAVSRVADAVVVGSALVSRVEALAERPDEIADALTEVLSSMRRAMDG